VTLEVADQLIRTNAKCPAKMICALIGESVTVVAVNVKMVIQDNAVKSRYQSFVVQKLHAMVNLFIFIWNND
jgi:hypothetical protein